MVPRAAAQSVVAGPDHGSVGIARLRTIVAAGAVDQPGRGSAREQSDGASRIRRLAVRDLATVGQLGMVALRSAGQWIG